MELYIKYSNKIKKYKFTKTKAKNSIEVKEEKISYYPRTVKI